MNKEVTLFITSCGRPKLLRRTLESFVKYNTYPIKEVIVCEDSGKKGIVDFVKEIVPYPVIFCYNEVRSGQMKTIERHTPLVKTPYVFHLEDDYEFFDYGFIELSLKIMETDDKIAQVLLEEDQYTFDKEDIGNPLCYKLICRGMVGEKLSCYSWRPSLKKIEIQKLRMPYELWDDEGTIQLLMNKLGYYSVISKEHYHKQGKKGFCTNIGNNDHVEYTGTKILTKADFPERRYMTMNDI
jgi:hypothetical protein